MDFHTEKPILIDGKEITASTSFIAESPSGTVNVEFVFDQNKLTTDRVVAFEKVEEGERLIAVHADINDLEQTINVITYRILKKDAITKVVLDEAEFTRWDQDGNIIEVKSSDENGVVEFKLFYGEVNTTKETDAPVGYVLSEEIVTMDTTMHEDGTLFEIEYFNDLLPVVELPGTGLGNTNVLLGTFIVFLGFVLILAALIRKRLSKEADTLQVSFGGNAFYSDFVKEDFTQENELIKGTLGKSKHIKRHSDSDSQTKIYVDPNEEKNE